MCGIDFQSLREVPGNRLTLAIQVGCEPDVGCVLGSLLQIGDGLLFRRHDFVSRLEVILQIDARHRALDALGILTGQVADMTHRGHHDVVTAEVLINSLGLGGRLDDDELLAAAFDVRAVVRIVLYIRINSHPSGFGGLAGLGGARFFCDFGHRYVYSMSDAISVD